MIRLLIISILFLAIFQVKAAEIVHLKNGQFQRGKVVSQTDEALVFEFRKSGQSDSSRVTIPWKSITRIEFTSSVEQIDALSKPEQTDIKILMKLWNQAQPWISRPDSRAAEIGLIYAQKLAASDTEMAPEQALDLYQLISSSAWKPEHQAAAVRGRLTTLLSMGKEKDAIREAEELAVATENPSHLLEAKHVLATDAFEKLQAIEKDNPRWHLDDEVRPTRNQHFNTAIDHSLFTCLFFGSEDTSAARGLTLASEIYQFAQDTEKAKHCLEDILKLYPDTPHATPAKQQLAKLSKQKN